MEQFIRGKKDGNVGKNTAYNLIKNIFGIIFPLVTFPYISRVLGVENVGKINYGNSIVSYFSLIASLGISTYAIRECAKVKEDHIKLSNEASQIFSINIFSTIIAYAALLVTLLSARKLDPYRGLILIQSVSILFTTLGADWLNTAVEDFRYITLRTVSMQMISLVLMIVFVRNPQDYIKYAVISVAASSGANLLNIFYRRRYCETKFTFHIEWKKHLAPIMLLFSMILSQTIYTSSDMTMLGLMKGDWEVGLYSTSVKIYNMVNTVVASIAYVVMPKLAMYYQKNDYQSINHFLRYALSFIVTLGLPCIIGINVITVPLLYTLAGKNYIGAATSLHILTIALAVSFIGGFFSNIIMLPSGRERYSLQSSVISALVNFLLNLVLIPKWGLNAAAFTTAIAEFFGMLVIKSHVEKDIRIERKWDICKAPLVGSLGIIVVSIIIKQISANNYFITISTIVFGVIIYALTLYLLKNELFMNSFTSFKKRFASKK